MQIILFDKGDWSVRGCVCTPLRRRRPTSHRPLFTGLLMRFMEARRLADVVQVSGIIEVSEPNVSRRTVIYSHFY